MVRLDHDVYEAFRVQAFHTRRPITVLANDMLRIGLVLAEAGALNLPAEEIIRLVRERNAA